MAVGSAIEAAKADKLRPSFITVKTRIGFGCPAKEGKASSAHGEPLGESNVTALKVNLGWDSMEAFYVPREVYENCRELALEGEKKEAKWAAMFQEYKKSYPDMARLWERYHNPDIGKKLLGDEAFWAFGDAPEATRNLSGIMINRLKDIVPSMIGGAAYLAPSTKTYMKDEGDFAKGSYAGRNLHFGVRELAMLWAMPNFHVFRPADAMETAAAPADRLFKQFGITAECAAQAVRNLIGQNAGGSF